MTPAFYKLIFFFKTETPNFKLHKNAMEDHKAAIMSLTSNFVVADIINKVDNTALSLATNS